MTLADLAVDGSTGLEQAEPRRRRKGQRLVALIAIATVIGFVAARGRRRQAAPALEDEDGI
jgi:hypothetical protein